MAITTPPTTANLQAVPALVTEQHDFRLVFEETYQPLVAYARRRTATDADADDVVAEVYTTAWRRWSELEADRQPLPWLYAVAGNVLRNHWRSTKRRLRLVDHIEAQPQPSSPPNPADRQGAELREAMEQLADDDREVLTLMAWEGLTHAEIGEVLGCSANAVGIRIHRARQRLEVILDAATLDSHPNDSHPNDSHPNDSDPAQKEA